MPKFETICLISIGHFKTNFPVLTDGNGRGYLFNRKVGHSRVFCTLAKNTGELIRARAKEGQDEESPTGGLNWVRFLSDTETPSVTLWLVENLCQPSLKSLFRRQGAVGHCNDLRTVKFIQLTLFNPLEFFASSWVIAMPPATSSMSIDRSYLIAIIIGYICSSIVVFKCENPARESWYSRVLTSERDG